MPKLTVNQIRERALALLEKEPQGMRYMQLVRAVHDSAPETPINTVHGGVHSLLSTTDQIVRPSKGLWVLKKFADQDAPGGVARKPPDAIEIEQKGKKVKLSEEQFYEAFANWLKTDAEEVVETLVMGGGSFKSSGELRT